MPPGASALGLHVESRSVSRTRFATSLPGAGEGGGIHERALITTSRV